MATAESTLLVLLLILALGLIIPELFKKLKIPFVSVIIIIGAIVGPNGLDYIQHNEVVSFFGFLGMTFLMLMAGLEADFNRLKQLKKKIFVMSAFNGLIPFVVGVLITKLFGYSWMTSLLVGVVFISSSVAIAIPALRSAGLLSKDVGKLILASVLITDIFSLVLLSFILQGAQPITQLPLFLYFFIILISIAAIFYFIPRIAAFWSRRHTNKGYEDELRFAIVLVIAVLVYFSALGVHPILAAFIVGLTLSNLIEHENLYAKFHTLGYGLFVPVFFFIVGMEMDLKIFKEISIGNIVILSLVFGLILSKFISGYIAGRRVNLSKRDSSVFGITSIVQLTTTLAVTYAASTIGLLDSTLTTSIITLSVVTTILGPILLKKIVDTK